MRRIERQLISHLKRRGVPGSTPNTADTSNPPFILHSPVSLSSLKKAKRKLDREQKEDAE